MSLKRTNLPPGIRRSDLEQILRIFGLEDEWEIELAGRNDEGDFAAATTIEHDDYHVARIVIGEGWPDDRATQRSVLAHEAGHLLLADLTLAVKRATDLLDEKQREILAPIIAREEELLCDRIARLVDRAIATKPQR